MTAGLAFLPLVVLIPTATHGSKYPKYFGKFVDRVGDCGGYISSPNYPSRYQNGDSGYYNIRVPEHHYIVLTIISMDIEDSADCTEDHVTLYNGNDSRATVLSKLCGSPQDDEREYRTSGAQLFVYFESSQRRVGNNFIFQYEARPQPSAISPCPIMPTSDGCDGGVKIYTQRSGTITSPNYPNTYPNEADCKLAIDVSVMLVEVGGVVEFTWSGFNIEGHSSCKYDALQLYDPTSDTLYGPYCGYYTPRLWRIDSPLVYVMFRSDLSVVKTGFSLSYAASGQPEKRLLKTPITAEKTTLINNPDSTISVDPFSCSVARTEPGAMRGSSAVKITWSWHVGITTPSGYVFCGGSIVHPYYVVVAAHCVVNDQPNMIRVVVGAQSYYENRAQITVEDIYRHPGYDIRNRANDIAVLKLAQPLTFNSTISPVCVSDSTDSGYEGDVAYSYAWNATGNKAGFLQTARVKVVSNSECSSYYPHGMHAAMLCTQGQGQDWCDRTIRGPLVVKVSGSYTLIGVFSFSRCGEELSPSVYTRISTVYNWLIQFINSS